MLQPGTIVLEKYRVERVLGKGGMGFVVAVRHVQLGELFAIKTMLPGALESEESVARFLREARACARLKGEHLARVHDVGNLPNGVPYMLMEYLAGQDLGRIVERHGALPLEEAILYVLQACEAVAEAHEIGIVHRDLKPSNLFLTQRPNRTPCIKVLDFGISKEINSENQNAKLTKTGQFMGSPMYMSPEQMADVRMADTRSDIWSLGVILYELVTGCAPFFADTVTAVVTKVLLSQPDPPSKLRSDLPITFDSVVLRCLEKQPEARYQSISELVTALEPFMSVPASAFDRSGSYPRIAVPSRLEMVDTSSVAAISSPAQVAETLPHAARNVSETMTNPAAASSAFASTLEQPSSASIVPTTTVPLLSLPIAMASSAQGDTLNAHQNDSMALQAPPAYPLPRSGANTGRRTLIAAAIVVSVLGLSAFVMTRAGLTSVHDADPHAASEKAATIPSPNTSLPDVAVTFPTVSGEAFPSVAPLGSAHPVISSAAAAKSAPEDMRPTSTVSTSKPTQTTTSKRVTTKKLPVRGYDD